jgi:nucleotide-binding universal stress UspA family protein
MRPLIALNSWDIGQRKGAKSGGGRMAAARLWSKSAEKNGYEEDEMRGTIVCGVTETGPGREALTAAVELSKRLGLRLVLAHVAEGIGPIGDGNNDGDGDGDGVESVTMQRSRQGAVRVVERLALEFGIAERAERRSAVGDPAALLGRIAAEEGADVILVGARARGRLRRGLESRFARQLEVETQVPVLIAPSRARVTRVGGRK